MATSVTIGFRPYLYSKQLFLSLTNYDIQPLLVLCQEGNQLAQLEVYNRYQRAMFNVSKRIVKDSALAEDVMQESFIAAFQKLDSFRGTATFGSWLKRIVINNSLLMYKRESKFLSMEEDHLSETADVEVTPSEATSKNIHSQHLISALESLHDRYRTILTLHFIEGYDYEELCDILEISYANCRTLISRAKDSLRKKLKVAS